MTYGIGDIIKDTLTGNAQFVEDETFNKRVSICEKCEHYTQLIPLTGGNCSLCGCFIRKKNKYKQSQCPDNPPRWLAQ